MATNTTNYGFKRPDESEFYSIGDQNNNWDRTDNLIQTLDYPDFEDYAGDTTLPDPETALVGITSNKKHTNLFSNIKAVLTGAFLKKYILKTMEEVMANTLSGRLADALLIKQLNSDLAEKANSSALANVSAGLATANVDINPLKSNRVSHISSNILNKVNIVLWFDDTADTPFKAGLTTRGNGFCITYSSGEPYLCQLAMAVGDSHLFTRNSGPGGWSGWTVIGTPSG